jgi:starch synthase
MGDAFSTYDTSSMLTAVQKAVSVYPDRHLVDRLRRNGMARSFSWNRAAEAYLGLYDRLASRQFGAAEKASPM